VIIIVFYLHDNFRKRNKIRKNIILKKENKLYETDAAKNLLRLIPHCCNAHLQ